PLPKSNVGAGLLAHVIVSKFCDHLPLHRQEAILARHGWDVRRSTLCDHLQKCGRFLKPLYDLMHWRLLPSFAVHADDTPLVLLRPRRTAFAWVSGGANIVRTAFEGLTSTISNVAKSRHCNTHCCMSVASSHSMT